MKTKNICLLALTTLLSTASAIAANTSQTTEKIVITGTVTDKMGNKLKGAPITIVNDNDTYTLTDQNGSYSIEAMPGSKIAISYIGYKSDTLTVSKSANIDVKLYTEEDLKSTPKNNKAKNGWIIGAGAGVSVGF